MNANSPDRAFTKARQLIVIAMLITVGMFATVAASAAVTIVDSLGIATTETKFRASEAGGLSIIPSQFPGVKFTLTQPTTITEIGAFVHSFNNQPIIVEIRPSTNGLPDVSTVLASFVLSNDGDPVFISFESVSVNLHLEPGMYFALFAPQPGDQGFLVGTAIGSFIYESDFIEMGFLNPLTGNAAAFRFFGAVRILGVTNVFVDDCDTGVSDVVLPGGDTITDLIESCEDASFDRGSFVSCVARATGNLMKAGIITGQEKGAIQRCVGQSNTR